MLHVFISQSRSDDVVAVALRQWLIGQRPALSGQLVTSSTLGTMVPATPDRADALNAAVQRCAVVICLVSRNWLRSKECEAEYRAARYFGKPIYYARIEALDETAPTVARQPHYDLIGDGPHTAVAIGNDHPQVLLRTEGLRQLLSLLDTAGAGTDRHSVARSDQQIIATDPLRPSRPENSRLLAGPGRAVDARGCQGMLFGDYGMQVNIYQILSEPVVPPLITDAVPGGYRSPYRGLAWFTEQDAPLFFGRETATDDVLERLSQRVRRPAILLVSGVSGAGKSSLLRAGVVPQLRRTGLEAAPEARHWQYLLFSPGRDPLGALASSIAPVPIAATVRRELDTDPTSFALTAAQIGRQPNGAGRAPGKILLIVDQFEQIFTQCDDETLRAKFVTALHSAVTATAATVVLVVRADFESRCENYPELISAVQNRYRVTTMTTEQLAMAIAKPAQLSGSSVDDDLRDRLLRDIRTRTASLADTAMAGTESTAGVLPLLSHALDTAWRRRAGPTLTVADYEHSGGISGAVAVSAQYTFDALPPHRQVVARQIFTRLAVTGADGTDTADRVARQDLAPIASEIELNAVLEAFAGARLLTLGAETVEVSHEIVLRAWPLLRNVWLAQTHDTRATLARLRAAATEWNRHGRDASYLYRGSILDTAAAARVRLAAEPWRYPPLSAVEDEFLTTATRVGKQRIRRSRAIIGTGALLVVALTATTITAFSLRATSVQQREAAIADRLSYQSPLLAASDPLGSKLDAVAAWHIGSKLDEKTEDAAWAALENAAADPHQAAFANGSRPINTVAFRRDGSLAAVDDDGTIQLWDSKTHRRQGDPVRGANAPMQTATSTNDGSTLAIGQTDNMVRLWDTADHKPKPPLDNKSLPFKMAFSPDRRLLAVGDSDGNVRLWDAEIGKEIRSPLGSPSGKDAVYSLAFAADNHTLAIGYHSGAIRVWDTDGGIPVTIRKKGGNVFAMAFARDGTLATGSYRGEGRSDGEILLWHSLTGKYDIYTSFTAASNTHAMAFSSDSHILASAGEDGIIQLWDTVTPRPIGETLTGHKGTVWSIAFGPGNRTLASGGGGGEIRTWNIDSRRVTPDKLPWVFPAVLAAALAPDDRTLASGGTDQTIGLWNIQDNTFEGKYVKLPVQANAVTFADDGRALYYVVNNEVWEWDTSKTEPTRSPIKTKADVTSIAADASVIALGYKDGSVQLWDPSGKPLGSSPTTDAKSTIWSMAFGHDHKLLATGSDDSTVRQWDITDPARPKLVGQTRQDSPVCSDPIPHDSPVYSVAYGNQDRTMAVGGRNGTIQLWDTATCSPIGDRLIGHSGHVNAMAFSTDNRTLTSFAHDGTVQKWDVAYLINPLKYLCDWADGDFNAEVWNDHIPDADYRQPCP